MDIERLRSVIAQALKTMSAEKIAGETGGAITAKSVLNFKGGRTPQHRQRQALEQFAERWLAAQERPRPTMPAAASEAALREALGMIALSKIQAHAESILEELRIVTGKQERHIHTLDPWVELEAQGLARDIDREVVAHVEQEAAKELAAREAEQAEKDSGTPRRRRKRG